ncbi:hypothetical protein PPYR_04756 [Photinus pyralis]|uniref:C2H2-type domain-containing protein n=1 Tax=Photinus pyralis TaxID=7054 RepID=A0A5N4AZI8_PHOPY|nr:uncharacterized protein LOC116162648 isoform X2 [Photinus pyralis]KAB0802570.1 hypothetical protein PPYR_04756 [Photinus pyralis]
MKESVPGYRIVQIDYFINKMLSMQKEHTSICTASKLLLKSEKRVGLVSEYTFECTSCVKLITISSENPKAPKVNKASVWGTLSTGGCYAHLQEFLSVLDIPSISNRLYYKYQAQLSENFESILAEDIQRAAQKEAELAKQFNEVDPDGIPAISVYADGRWSKRSYGHSYNALSGTAVIIGMRTKQVLYLGVKNKYCSICARAVNRNEPAKEHLCYKNHDGSATTMEADILVDGFKQSEHNGLRYKRLIGDGDTNVMAKIRTMVPYGSTVEKVECVNHCLKNFTKNLYAIKKNVKGVTLRARQLLSPDKIKRLAHSTRKVLALAASIGNARCRDLISQVVYCVFGSHENCVSEYCFNSDQKNNMQAEVLSTGLHHHIFAALSSVMAKIPQLVPFETMPQSYL